MAGGKIIVLTTLLASILMFNQVSLEKTSSHPTTQIALAGAVALQ